MAIINTRVESGIFEAARRLSVAEKALPNVVDSVQIEMSEENSEVSISAEAPVDMIPQGGGLFIKPQDYAPIADFNATAQADLPEASSFTNAAAALFAMVMHLHETLLEAEADANVEFTRPAQYSLTYSINVNTRVSTFNLTLPATFELDAAGQTVTTVPNFLPVAP